MKKKLKNERQSKEKGEKKSESELHKLVFEYQINRIKKSAKKMHKG